MWAVLRQNLIKKNRLSRKPEEQGGKKRGQQETAGKRKKGF